MEGKWRDPYGSFLPALLYADWQDRRRADNARIAARWGYLKQPADRGKLIWLQCGDNDDSIELGSALTAAIRDRRRDLQLVLTVERATPILDARLQGLARTAWGYATSDRPVALARAFSRLDPFALIFCAVSPRPNMTKMASRAKHVLAVAPPSSVDLSGLEFVYPANAAQLRAWQHSPHAEPADMATLLVEAQVDPNFVSLVNGPHARHLWWLHSADARRAAAFAEQFKQRFAEDVLFISGALQQTASPISRWNRSVLAPGSVVAIDENKWLPAIAASVTATQLESPIARLLWQALAGGAPVAHDGRAELPSEAVVSVVDEARDSVAVLDGWRRYCGDPILRRKRADAARRAFWDERRRAARVNEELLARVFAW